MRYVTFRNSQGNPEPGVARDHQIIGLAEAGFHSVLEVVAGGDSAREQVGAFLSKAPASSVHDAASAKLMAPIPRPPKVICVGLNYRDHAEESNMAIPDRPTIFNKFPQSVISPGDTVMLPKASTQPDYEAEFAFVIGRGGKHIAADNWKAHVFGYCNLNDVSARDLQLATTQWLMGKTCDTFCPMGPYLVTADEVADPHNLNIKMTINGEVLQNSNTKHLIFRIPDLIAYLSSAFTLEPGDVISTGTPSGVGMARKPPRFLKAGDDMVVEVEGLGQLRNPVAVEA